MSDRTYPKPNETMSRGLPREIAPGITWIGACLEFDVDGSIIHGHTSAYVLCGSDAALMIDTGNPSSWPVISDLLDRILGGRPLDYLFPTHPELPHTGNMQRLATKYPDLRIVGDIRDYHLFYPNCASQLEPMVPGDRIDLGDTEFLVVDAFIRDLPNTQWGYAPHAHTLFSADGFCYMHRPELDEEDPMHVPGECGLTTSELRQPVSVENAGFFTGSALYWARFVDDADELYAHAAAELRDLDVQIIAPTHGNVITDVPEMIATVHAGHKAAYRYHDDGQAAVGAVPTTSADIRGDPHEV
jgi:flavorubredoxin